MFIVVASASGAKWNAARCGAGGRWSSNSGRAGSRGPLAGGVRTRDQERQTIGQDVPASEVTLLHGTRQSRALRSRIRAGHENTMDSRLQRRVQRYGWDLAAAAYEPLWRLQLAGAQTELIAQASLAPGDRVLDVACGTGLVALAAAKTIGPRGSVLGIDLSATMVDAAQRRAHEAQASNATFARMDAEKLDLPDAVFDVVLCALGLMYVPDSRLAVREMHRVLRPGGRMVLAVWGERSRCGWSPLFPIVDAEVASEVCPLFFSLGARRAGARLCGRRTQSH